ncbi:MAG TPA: hypothetical protein VND95_00025 [Stellaceae bacterium]|nr:hypothetical protein [Stellaceae bacterium]
MIRKLIFGAAALLLVGVTTAPVPAQAQRWVPEMRRLHALCNRGYRPACIRFGFILGANRARQAEWRRLHPNWWWWQPWVR